jgi:hypothetical protein
MVSRRVKCITKRDRQDRHERISHIGGDWGRYGQPIKITEEEAIRDIELGIFQYHVTVNNYNVKVIISFNNGRKYLKTENDTTTVDNLLSLPECNDTYKLLGIL